MVLVYDLWSSKVTLILKLTLPERNSLELFASMPEALKLEIQNQKVKEPATQGYCQARGRGFKHCSFAAIVEHEGANSLNHPGLLEEIEPNTAAGIDVHIVACQAATQDY